jgi:serine/threonine protein kinase
VSRRCPQCGTEYPDTISFCGNDGVINIQVPPAGQIADARLGAHYGEYVVVAHVADGAMGRVYEGRHAQTRKRVAIKVLHADVAKDKVAVERFKREFETAQGIDSPYVVRVIDFGETPDASFFLTMEYLEGLELGTLLRSEGAQPMARTLRILSQLALGLEDAHSFGVIHRDLKPDNVFLVTSPEGDQVRILDFGSVKLQMETGPKLTAFGTTLGSPYYMSPEQAMGKSDVDNRTDGFALAAILYEMLTGTIAFDGKAVAEILMKIVNQMPPPLSQVKPGLPATLDDVIEKGVAKNKVNRYPSTTALAAAALSAVGLATPPDRAAVEAWGKKPVAEIEAALATAKPPVAAAFGAAPSGQAPMGQAPMGQAPMAPMGQGGGFSQPASIAPTAGRSMLPFILAGLGLFVFATVALALGAWFYMG